MAKTIKQIADDLGVSKTAVRKKIENLGFSDKLKTIGNRIAVDERQEALIKSAFLEKEPETGNRKRVSEKPETLQLVSDMVSALKEQLQEKDRQLAEKDKQLDALQNMLAENQRLLDQQQQLNAMAEQRAKLLEQKEEQTQDKKPEEKETFWSRLLHKGSQERREP